MHPMHSNFRRLLHIVLGALAVLLAGIEPASAATCSGGPNCRACSTCQYCQHCAKEGGICSVKEAILARQQAPVSTPPASSDAAAPSALPAQPPVPAAPAATPPVVAMEPTTTALLPAGEQLATCIAAIAAQSDPAKLATLGERQVNPRLKPILYYLAAARDYRQPARLRILKKIVPCA